MNKINKKEPSDKKTKQAESITNCFARAASAMSMLHGHGRLLDCSTVAEQLMLSSDRINDGNIQEVEDMLMTQAKILDHIFYDALEQLSSLRMISHIEVYSNLAFRAQSQCRKTLSTLAELKHPRRVMFVKQQNNTVNQQINHSLENGNSEKIKNVANELLKEVNHEALDSRGASATIRANKEMEALEISRG
jgi:hypothetical protein